MNYIVTARKWRPQTFEQVVGQEHITVTIKNAILNNRVAHAYIFTGPRGCGKTTTARILAKTLNCLNVQNGEPCNKCEMCESFLNSQSLDIIEIDGASNRRIEEIRSLRESVKYAPTKGKYKVYIIDEVHMLTTESFNALLKTLEEPPEHTIFIFATTDIHKVPLTIISRCQRFDFRRIEITAMKEHLKKIADHDNIQIDDVALTLIAKKADGALRDAQSIFDQVISFSGNKVDSTELARIFNLIDEEVYFTISDSILNKDFSAAFDISQKIYENGWNYVDFLNGLIEHFRNILTVVIRKDTKLIETADIFKQRFLQYQDRFSEGDLLRILNFVNKTQYELKSSSNQKLKVEVALAHLIGLERTSTITELISKLDKSGLDVKISPDMNSNYSAISSNSKINEPLNNIETILKKDVELPKVESFITPVVDNDTNFTDLIDKWKNFVEQVQSEKFFFGSILLNSKPISFSGEQIDLEVEDPNDEHIIKENEPYLDKKIKEVFGKKVKVGIKQKKKSSDKHNPSSHHIEKSSLEESQIAAAIINQLGGKEIRK